MKGIDGTRNGWVSAEYFGNTWKIDFHKKLENIDFRKALVDIPIGLPEDSVRECDIKARDFLSPERHYSIFNCPVRDAVYADSYEEACGINEEKTGKRISKQAWNITPKIREANQVEKNRELRESHPEVFFKSIEKSSVKHSKNTEKGLKERRKVLEEFSDVSPADRFEAENVSKDDIFDAMILALGKRFNLETLPKEPPKNAEGIPMKIVRPETKTTNN